MFGIESHHRMRKQNDKEKLKVMGENHDREKRITIESETRTRELSFGIKTIMIRYLDQKI